MRRGPPRPYEDAADRMRNVLGSSNARYDLLDAHQIHNEMDEDLLRIRRDLEDTETVGLVQDQAVAKLLL